MFCGSVPFPKLMWITMYEFSKGIQELNFEPYTLTGRFSHQLRPALAICPLSPMSCYDTFSWSSLASWWGCNWQNFNHCTQSAQEQVSWTVLLTETLLTLHYNKIFPTTANVLVFQVCHGSHAEGETFWIQMLQWHAVVAKCMTPLSITSHIFMHMLIRACRLLSED